ncbi:MAG: 16S rRNA (guanine(966)-N(2))-methyltransferase RsmD [Synechococcales cyanobacterium CRU_2_2]|nr:16S rRNA (guanine(966)-N(2))-methyltransferase RsmD [Synechococcales cyanobacterium CRU_2_2]
MALRIYGNRLLQTLPGNLSRPTQSRVRESLFNIWQGKIEGCRWLDLCSGSGAMGAEALCRGAAVVVGVEQAAPALKVIEANWHKVARPEQTVRLLRGDVIKRLPQLAGQQFDRIYFDPPYESGLYGPALGAIVQYQLLAVNGVVAVEHDCQRSLPLPEGLSAIRSRTYGRTSLTFCAREQIPQ